MTRNKLLICILAFLSSLLCSTAMPAAAVALTKQQADSAYAKADYRTAATAYEALLKKGVSATLYYNLGNAYYRLNDWPKAVLNYERALKYEPAYADAHYNLDVCRSKMSVPRDNATGMFFLTWMNETLCSQSADFWGIGALCAFVCCLLGWGGAHFVSHRVWRKVLQSFTCLSLCFMLFALVAAAFQSHRFHNEQRAVVMVDTALRSENSKGAKQLLVAGTAVLVLDESPDGHLLVERSDKSLRGWVNAKDLARI